MTLPALSARAAKPSWPSWLNPNKPPTTTGMTILSQQVNEDHYAIEWEVAGTNTGALGDLPATNKPYRFRGASIGRLDTDGKIKENRDYYDMAGYLTQVGLLPPLGP
jgi:hypothetical protein